ncbi:MAG: N-acetylmuramoyl-L-alanine amidase [Chthoniobacter sp.]|nr:N-acetylmuramoyl-L-alanine amidase [Chthoniobacter sp.]
MKKSGSLLFLLVAVLSLAASPAWARPTVVIDAGHGGHDRGGVPGDRYPEKVYTLDVARRLQARLAEMGYRTMMTRRGDYFVGLDQRCYVANSMRDAIFVSIHFNSAPREGASGIETYYYSRRSGSLASAVHRSVVRGTGSEDRRVRARGFYVIRNTRCPAILVEGGFLTNRSEGARIAGSGAYRQRLADSIARGIRSRY